MKFDAPAAPIKVAVLGATGSVGQRFIQLLDGHPWFEVAALGASPRSAGKKYFDVCQWKQSGPIPKATGEIVVSECTPKSSAFDGVKIVFSGLDADYAGSIEDEFASHGCAVFSNALKPIHEKFGLDTVMVTTMQAISGAGYPGLSSMDMLDNIVPLIGGEEAKMETESKKVFASVVDGAFHYADFDISAMCNRVHVLDGHTECVSLKLKKKATPGEIIDAINSYPSITKGLGLPSAPTHDVVYNTSPDRPQPRLDRSVGDGYTVTVGRVRECNVFDARLVLFGHNTIVGAAGGSILNAELCVVEGLVK